MKFIPILLFLFLALHADIQLIKKENKDSNTTLLIIGGIHGNEPGGYETASILATHYTITSKNLWIVPNLNKDSIRNDVRGINGDMNRKFAYIKKNDKDRAIIEAIKKIITNKKVSLILNLHDGHGFYREKYKNSILNPKAWGQTCVIDQCKLDTNQEFGNLDEIASLVKNRVNKDLLNNSHVFNVKNTNTKIDDKQMQLSLTYYAIRHNKPAFAIETSKSLKTVAQKVFYQLTAIEEFMNIAGIKYERNFELNIQSISKIVKNYGFLNINDNIKFDLTNIKNSLSYIPIKSSNNKFKFSNPLGDIEKKHGRYDIYIASKKVVSLKPQYFRIDDTCFENFKAIVDGKEVVLQKTSNFYAKKSFKIENLDGIRVNVIGFSARNRKNESGVTIYKNSLLRNYSVDTKNKVYRIEFYKKKKFCSMSTVTFQ